MQFNDCMVIFHKKWNFVSSFKCKEMVINTLAFCDTIWYIICAVISDLCLICILLCLDLTLRHYGEGVEGRKSKEWPQTFILLIDLLSWTKEGMHWLTVFRRPYWKAVSLSVFSKTSNEARRPACCQRDPRQPEISQQLEG